MARDGHTSSVARGAERGDSGGRLISFGRSPTATTAAKAAKSSAAQLQDLRSREGPYLNLLELPARLR
jgi:hypothetical protein